MATTQNETFGQRVRSLRQKKGIRQTDLAARAGLSWRHLIRIEQDAGGTPKPTTVTRLAEALGVPASELGASDDDEEDSQVLPSLDALLRLRVQQILREEAQA